MTSASGSGVPLGETPSSAEPEPGATPVDLQIVESAGATLVLVEVVVNDSPLTFVVDTGASVTVVDLDTVRSLGVEVQEGTVELGGIGGAAGASKVLMDNWAIGGSQLPGFVIAAIDVPKTDLKIAGFLGSDVLKTFHKITIDYAAGTGVLG